MVGATILPSPDGASIADATVLLRGGKIESVGPAGTIAVPPDARILDGRGLFVTAAFQNSDVHFTEEKWRGAADLPAEQLTAQLEEMFSQYGFTTVFETASFAENTLALRSRVESGEVTGPRILTAGPSCSSTAIAFSGRSSMVSESSIAAAVRSSSAPTSASFPSATGRTSTSR